MASPSKTRKPKPKTPYKRIVQSYCVGCGEMKKIDNFYKSTNEKHKNKVLPFCIDCVESMNTKFIKKYGSIQAGIYFTCAEMGIAFIMRAYLDLEEELNVMTNEGKEVNNHFALYLSCLLEYTKRDKRLKIEDFGRSDLDLQDVKRLTSDLQSIKLERSNLETLWGKQYSDEQLAYLEYRFTSYTKDKILEEYEEMTYRNLCKAELDIYENEDIGEAMKRQNQCAKILKLDNFEGEKRKTLVEKTIESDIFLMEKEEPAEFYKDKGLYQDFRGIGKSWVLEILRPLKNLISGSKEYPVSSDEMFAFDEREKEIIANENGQ